MFKSLSLTKLSIATILFCLMSLRVQAEEKKLCIRDIEFTGNKAFTERQLRNGLSTVPYLEAELKKLTEQEQATRVTDLLKLGYFRTGFFDANISASWDQQAGAERRLRVLIDESVPYHLTDIVLRGLDDHPLEKEVHTAIQTAILRLQDGNSAPCSKEALGRSAESSPQLTSKVRACVLEERKESIRWAINDAIRQSGFAKGDFILTEERDAEQHGQNIIVTFASIGPKIRVEQIRVTGLERDTEVEFLTFVGCEPGMDWNETKWHECERKLRESGRFQQHTLGVSFSPIDPSVCIVSFHVVECPAMPRLSEKLSEDQETLKKMAIQLSVQSQQNLKATFRLGDRTNLGSEPETQITLVFGKDGFVVFSDCVGELDFFLDAADTEANIWCDGERVFSTNYGMLGLGVEKRPQVNMKLKLTGASVVGEKSNLQFGFEIKSDFSEFSENRIDLPPFYFLKQELQEISRTPESIRVTGEDFAIVQDAKNGQIVSLDLMKRKEVSSIDRSTSFHFEFGEDFYNEIHATRLSKSSISDDHQGRLVSDESLSGTFLALIIAADIANHSHIGTDIGKIGESSFLCDPLPGNEFPLLAFASRCSVSGFGKASPQVKYVDELYGSKHLFPSEIGAATMPILLDNRMGPISCTLLAFLQMGIGYTDSRLLVKIGMERCNPESVLAEAHLILAKDRKMLELLRAVTEILRTHPHWLQYEPFKPYFGALKNELTILLKQDKSTETILNEALDLFCKSGLVDVIKRGLVNSYASPIDLAKIPSEAKPGKESKTDSDKEKKTGKIRKEPYKMKLDGLRFSMPK